MSSSILSVVYTSSAYPLPTETIYGVTGEASRRTTQFDDVIAAEGWIDRKNDLKVIRRYRDDWDGMGAIAPTPHIIDTAVRVLERMQNVGAGVSPPSAVSGTPMGHVTLEWHIGHDYLEAELVDAEHIEWMEERDGQFREWTERLIEDQPSRQYISTVALLAEPKEQMWSSSSTSVPYIKS